MSKVINKLKQISVNKIVLVFFVFSTFSANAVSIKGKIINSDTKETIPGVSIFVKNTVIGTTTNINGEFILKNIPSDSDTVVFSCVGFEIQELNILNNKQDTINIELQPSSLFLEEVVISTAKNELKSFEQTTPASVITQNKITENVTQNIADIVDNEPSVSHVGGGFYKAPSIRGLAQKRIVVLIDGERISSERNSGAPGTFINPLDVKNVEILRGPYSTLYGSDAVGGVVNIISKDYIQSFSNKYVGGIFNSNYQSIRNGYNANLMLNSKINDKVFLHFTAGKRKADSYKDAQGDDVMSTNFSEQSVSSKITWQINENHKLKINGLLSLADSIGNPAYSDSLNAIHPKDNHYKIGLNYQWKNIFNWMPKMSIKASSHRHKINARIYNYTNIQYGRVLNLMKDLYNTDYIYQHEFNFTISPKIKLLSGFDFYQRDGIHIDEHLNSYFYDLDNPNFYIGDLAYEGVQDTTIDDSYQRSFGLFAQANYFLSKKLSFNTGLRWNYFKTNANLITTISNIIPYDYSLNKHETKTKSDKAFSGNSGLSYMPNKYVNITFNIGQAFRVPSTKELFINTMTPGGMNFCNPNLVPERSVNLDFGVKLKDKKYNNISFALFRNEINNMIILEWDSLHASGEFNNKNAFIYGGEITFDLKLNKRFVVNGNLSYVKGFDDNDEVFEDIPPFQINMETRYLILPNKLFVALSGKYNAKQSEVAIGDVPTDAFVVLDFLSSFNVNKYFKATFSVTNILNNDYREHYQFYWVRQPGRSFNAGIQINF